MLTCALVLSSRAQCICDVGVAKRKIPHLFKVFARLFNIKLPGRLITVPGLVVDGKRHTLNLHGLIYGSFQGDTLETHFQPEISLQGLISG